MLFAYKIVFSTLLCSRYTNAIAIKDAMGRAIIKPAILGCWPASQEEKAINQHDDTLNKIIMIAEHVVIMSSAVDSLPFSLQLVSLTSQLAEQRMLLS